MSGAICAELVGQTPVQQMLPRKRVMFYSRRIKMHINKRIVPRNNGSLLEIVLHRISQPAALGSPMTRSVPDDFRRNVAKGPTMQCAQIDSGASANTCTPAALGKYAVLGHPLSSQHERGCIPRTTLAPADTMTPDGSHAFLSMCACSGRGACHVGTRPGSLQVTHRHPAPHTAPTLRAAMRPQTRVSQTLCLSTIHMDKAFGGVFLHSNHFSFWGHSRRTRQKVG